MSRLGLLAGLCALLSGCASPTADQIGDWEGSCTLVDNTWGVEVGVLESVEGSIPELRGEDGLFGWGALVLGEARYAGRLEGRSLSSSGFSFIDDGNQYGVLIRALEVDAGTREGSCEITNDVGELNLAGTLELWRL